MAKSASSTLPTVPELMAAGAHFGHKKHRSHPGSRKYVFTIRDRVLVINLDDTARQIGEAVAYITELSKRNALILFVGTKRQASEPIKLVAEALEQPYVNQRWLGGTLTNFETIQARLRRMRDLETDLVSETFAERFSKKERLMLQREYNRLTRALGGIKKLTRVPDCMVIVDTHEEANALAEARRLKIPVVAIVDTNANPDDVTMPIVANDDSAKTVQLILDAIKDAAMTAPKPTPVAAPETAAPVAATPVNEPVAIEAPVAEAPAAEEPKPAKKPAAKKAVATKTAAPTKAKKSSK